MYPAEVSDLATNLVWRGYVQEARLDTQEHNHFDNMFKLPQFDLVIWLLRNSVLEDRLGRTSKFSFQIGDLDKENVLCAIGARYWQIEE